MTYVIKSGGHLNIYDCGVQLNKHSLIRNNYSMPSLFPLLL